MSNTPRLGAPELVAAQALPETTVNEQLRFAEQGAGFFIVADKDLATPPGSPADGDAYIVAGSPTGAWTGKAKSIAFYMNTGWLFIAPIAGSTAFVQDEAISYRYSGSAWAVTTAPGVGTAAALNIDTDGTLAANSDSLIATQKAVKTAIAAAVTGLWEIKGSQDCSANPNYPAGSKGDAYIVSVAGKIGGGSGVSVEAGDVYVALADNAGGTQASVGTSWFTIEHNLAGALLGSNNLSDVASAATSRTNLGATTAGAGLFTLANPSAITFLRVNADNSVSALSASAFRTAIGAGTGTGDLVAANNLSDVANAATAGANIRPVESLLIACGDESTAITTGVSKVTFRMPYAFVVTAVRASVNTAPTGSTILIDINETGVTILSTKLMIDATEKTSQTAATAAVISDANLADDAEISIDFDQVGSTIAGAGVKVMLIGHRV